MNLSHSPSVPVFPAEPPLDCHRCSRLEAFRNASRAAQPEWHNAPVESFGSENAQLLIVGLAPGLQGANRTGRPFTGDFAGDLLYSTLLKFGFARGVYAARPDDGLMLAGTMITNAVRCAPPQNKPTAAEIRSCRDFLKARIETLPDLKAIICLGRIAHDSTLAALGVRPADAPFAHGARRIVRPQNPLTIFDSYHCSRYNTNTGRLTEAMFENVFAEVRKTLDAGRGNGPN